MHDHDDFAGEPIPGLPAAPPEGETILWQGAPQWRSLAVGAFFVRPVAAYFALLAIWRIGDDLTEGAPLAAALLHAAGLLPIAALALGLLCLLAYASARTTVYTITSRRVAMRIGMALSLTLNLPFKQITAASLRRRGKGLGDISLTIDKSARIGFTTLWPHVRAWTINYPQPTLRSLPEAEKVARLLAEAAARTVPVARGAEASRTGKVSPGFEPVAAGD
jgi:hypothetical protein